MLRLTSLIALLALSTAASAQVRGSTTIAAPTLQRHVTVASDIVRIGDLVENAGLAANIPIFRAPDLGETGTVTVQRVVEALRPHSVIALNTAGIAEVIVTRASRAITPNEIEARVVQALLGADGFREAADVTIAFDQELRTVHLEPSATGELQLVQRNFNPRSGRFDLTLDLPTGSSRKTLRLTGVARETD